MAFGTRAIGTLAAVVLALLLSACGGDGESTPLLTLTDGDCTYKGDQAVSATATFEAELENKSSKLGAFEIVKIDAGGTFADVEAYVQSEQQRLEEGLEIAGLPTYLTLGARSQVARGDSGNLVSTVTPGTWVLWCAHNHPPTAVFLIAPPLAID